jgi:TatD DNase family protein
MNFIDTHAHLYLKEFDEDRDQMIQRALNSKVDKIILPNIDLDSLPSVLDLADRFPTICYPAIGLHPCDVKLNYKEILSTMEQEMNSPKYIAIGETGTDAYWDTTFWQEQLDAFSIQLEWSKTINKPIIIHSRETIDQNIDLVSKHQDGRLKGIFHCFTGTIEQASKIIDLGFYIGIGGVITYKKSGLKEVLLELGINNIVLETDAPFLSPVPNRGKRNESAYIPIIADYISESMQIPIEEISRITTENARKVFQLHDLS